MDKNELKKELMRSKAVAKLRHYAGGELHYMIESENGKSYMFSIPVVEEQTMTINVGEQHVASHKVVKLSSDLGTTAFKIEEKASLLWRWIDKAIDKGDFISLPLPPSGVLFYSDIKAGDVPSGPSSAE